MRRTLVAACLASGVMLGCGDQLLAQGAAKKDRRPALTFAGVRYFHRFTNENLHEYTPEGQENLKAWKDMVTINHYPSVKDGEALARTAEAVLSNYKGSSAKILRTSSVPRTQDNPAEHFIAAIFGRPEFIEVTFTRFKMHEGTGAAVTYSHRQYGKDVGKEMSAWLQKHGAATEQELMKWNEMPKKPSPR